MAKTSRHVGVAAEAFVAGQFARAGFDISVQYGANQPEYDLVVVRGDQLLKVSVKGSQDWGWGLTQTQLEIANKAAGSKANYQAAIDLWLAKHNALTIFAFVQFGGVGLNELPRMYLASPADVAHRLKCSAGGRGETILWEKQVWTKRAVGAGTCDEIPESWNFRLSGSIVFSPTAEMAGAIR